MDVNYTQLNESTTEKALEKLGRDLNHFLRQILDYDSRLINSNKHPTTRYKWIKLEEG